MATPAPRPAHQAGPRPNAPLDEPMPGLGDTIPEGFPPADEALGVEVPEEAGLPPVAGDVAVPVLPPTGPAGDPLPGAGEVVPVGPPPEDEALGVPLDSSERDS